MPRRKIQEHLSNRPDVLYAASLERIGEAAVLLDRDSFAFSMYASGLAVETLLQAFALRAGAAHDARHDLRSWLAKCPHKVIDLVSRTSVVEWSLLNTMWANTLRYLSEDGVLGHLRAHGLTRRIKLGSEGPRTAVRINARRLLDAAKLVHGKGIALWHAT